MAPLVHPDPGVIGPAVGDQVVHHPKPVLQLGNRLAPQVYRAADSAHEADMIAEPATVRWEAAPRGTHAGGVAPK